MEWNGIRVWAKGPTLGPRRLFNTIMEGEMKNEIENNKDV